MADDVFQKLKDFKDLFYNKTQYFHIVNLHRMYHHNIFSNMGHKHKGILGNLSKLHKFIFIYNLYRFHRDKMNLTVFIQS